MAAAWPRLLAEGDTCWRLAPAGRAAVLVDAADYFAALRATLLAAERSIVILGWEIHSRVRLEGHTRPTDGAPIELGRLLRWLLKHRPQLELRILLWNHPVFYSIQRELFPRYILGRRRLDRVEILLDDHLPLGASHHEKLVVVDDAVAFCGGIDLTVRRWDTSAHHPDEPRRRYRSRKPYMAVHDVQMIVDGAAAAAIGTRARERWRHAGGADYPEIAARGDAWPRHVTPDFENVEVGVIRTLAALEDHPEDIREVEQCTVAAISRAERLIYIENQYVTSKTACDALVARMRENPRLQAIVVTSREPGGWLEARTMGVGRQQFMAAFDAPDLIERIRFVAPVVRRSPRRTSGTAEMSSVHVHAKVLVVDDTFLRIGSSNLNNRSMGFDTECDLGIEGATPQQRETIAAVRNRLVAEHWGVDAAAVARAVAAERCIAEALDALPHREVHSTAHGRRRPAVTPRRRAQRAPALHRVVPIEREAPESGSALVVQLGDPERTVSAEELMAQTVGIRDTRPLLRVVAGIAAVAIVAALAIWLHRSGWLDMNLGSRLVAGIEALGKSPWGIPLVIAAFVIGSLVAVPILAMIGATVFALGPVLGFICSAVGVMLAASATFATGRLIGRNPLRRLLGRRFDEIERRFTDRGVVAVAVIRKVPFAPFTVVNMLIGAFGIAYFDFLVGTALGMLPGIAAFAFVSDRALEAWREPTVANIALIGTALLVWLAIVFGVQRVLNRHSRR